MNGPPVTDPATPRVSVPLDFLTELAHARSLAELYQAIAVWLPQVFPADRVSVALQNSPEALRVVTLSGGRILESDAPLPIDGTRIGDCLRSRKPVITRDNADDTEEYRHTSRRGQGDFQSIALLPMVAADQCIGTLNFACYAPNAFSPDVIADLEKIAVWVASRVSHHRALDRLQASEARFNGLIENANSLIFAKTADGLMLIANGKFCDTFGIAAADVIGRFDHEIFGTDIAAEWRVNDRRVIDQMAGAVVEEDLPHADGSFRTHLTQKFPVFDPARNEHIICAISTDISEQKRIEHALAESEQRSQAFFDNAPSAMYMKDTDHAITFANKQFLAFNGLTAEHVLGARSAGYVDPDTLTEFETADREIIVHGKMKQFEAQMRSGAGEMHDFVITKFPVYDGEGETIGVGGVNTDVTELRQSEKELRLAMEKAEEAARMFEEVAHKAETADHAKSEFLASMSHELRTPLNGVMGMANLLLDSDLNAEQRDKIGTILASGQSLLMLLNDVLDISKIEAGGMELEAHDFSVAAMMSSVENLWKPQAVAKGLGWACTIDTPVAPVIRADDARLRQVVFNLVSNALKFTDSGQISISISQVGGTGGAVETRFEISDTGAGIPPGLEEKLFEKFTQADTSISRRYGGTGLGLAICKSLVECMGGEIVFESRPGHGSTFRFSITCPAGSEAAIYARPDRPEPGEAPTKPLRILVAEDHAVNQQVISLMLMRAGHRCDIASNGIEAVAAVAAVPYDLILMDVQMPEMDGIAATRRIRELPGPGATIPIIALTANAMKGDRERYLEAGMNDYVAKPIEPEALSGAIMRQMAVEFALSGVAPATHAGMAADLSGALDTLFDGLDLPTDPG